MAIDLLTEFSGVLASKMQKSTQNISSLMTTISGQDDVDNATLLQLQAAIQDQQVFSSLTSTMQKAFTDMLNQIISKIG